MGNSERERVEALIRKALDTSAGSALAALREERAKTVPSFKVDGWVDFDGHYFFGEHILAHIHDEKLCKGRHCVIHNPSDHHMRDLPLIWDAQETQMMRLCEHDLVHPDPDDIAYWVNIAKQPWKTHHECCANNCCKEPLT